MPADFGAEFALHPPGGTVTGQGDRGVCHENVGLGIAALPVGFRSSDAGGHAHIPIFVILWGPEHLALQGMRFARR